MREQQLGEPWITELPPQWEMRRFKHAAVIRDGQVDPKNEKVRGLPLYAPNHIESGSGRLLAIESAEEQGAESGKYPVQRGEIVYSKIRPALRKVILAPQDGLCSADMYAIRPFPDVVSKFLFWSMLSDGFNESATLASDRVAMPKVNRETLKEFPIPCPPLPTQTAIADFLDRKTAALDALIEKKERLIALLAEKRAALIHRAVTKGLDPDVPMKDSGVPWIGEIPAHWEVKRLKSLAEIRGGVTKGRDLRGRRVVSLPYLRVANVQDGFVDLTEVHEIEVLETEMSRYSLRKGDILMNEGGDNDKLGRGTVWAAEIEPCLHQNHVFAVRPRSGANPYWISLCTSAPYLRYFFFRRAKQSTNLASISSSNVKEAPVLTPPDTEQDLILKSLGRDLARLARTEGMVSHQIDRLKEYRQALITAAVTGQLDIPEANP